MNHVEIICKRLSPEFHELALMDVYLEIRQQYATGECLLPPASDDWGLSSTLLKELRRRVRSRWCELSGLPPHEYPFAKGFVAAEYFKVKKRGGKEIEKRRAAWAAGSPLELSLQRRS